MRLLPVLLLTLSACGNDPFVTPPFKPDPALWLLQCGDYAVDWQDATCKDPQWTPGTCAPSVLLDAPLQTPIHVALPTPIAYADQLPLSGPHRPDPARAGEFAYLPPQRWLYNAERGGLVVLYHPCAPASLVDGLRDFVRAQQPDDTGNFRWVLTPYPALDSTFSLVTWGHRLKAECINRDEMQAFVTAHYRKAPEDEATDGTYNWAWLGRGTGLLQAPTLDPDAFCGDVD